jgi:hypothetical protein
VTLHFGAREGAYRPWWKTIDVRVHGPHPATKIIADQPRAAEVVIQ